jgi:hypothetical protein
MRKNGATDPPTSEPKPTIDVDQVLSLTRKPVEDELHHMIERVALSHFTDPELVAFAVLIRPVYDRTCAAAHRPTGPAVLKLVPPTNGAPPK